MAKTTRRTFVSDSEDEDSIATNSTAESEPGKDYAVDRILSQCWGESGLEYLIKWESYPLSAATWEPESNISGDVILRDWNRRQNRIAEGLEQPFDENEYVEAFETAAAQKEERQLRRRIKRRKRARLAQSEDMGSDDSHINNPKPEQQAKHVPAQRKGVAVKTKPKRRILHTLPSSSDRSDDGEAEHHIEDSELDSLFGDMQESADLQRALAPVFVPGPRSDASHDRREKGPAVGSDRKDSRQASLAQSYRPQQKVTTMSSNLVRSSAARKSAPNTASAHTITPPAKGTSKVFANWMEEKKSRQQPRVSGETPKDGLGPKFKSLSVQNRYQHYSRNERPPDINALNIVDPKTGKITSASNIEPHKGDKAHSDEQAKGTPSQIHDAYHRRTPPPASRQRSPSPRLPTTRDRRSVEAEEAASNQAANVDQQPNLPYHPATCRYWLQGDCKYTAEECRFSHSHMDTSSSSTHVTRRSKKETTCYWWRVKGKCSKPERDCEFAHRDTGYHAGAPGSFKSRGISAVNFVPLGNGTSGPPPISEHEKQQQEQRQRQEHDSEENPVDTTTSANISSARKESFSNKDIERPLQPRPSPHGSGAQLLAKESLSNKDRVRPPPPRPSPHGIGTQPLTMEKTRKTTPEWRIRGNAPLHRSVPSSASRVNATLLLSSEDEGTIELQVQLDVPDATNLKRLAGSEPVFIVDQIVMVGDFEHHMWGPAFQKADFAMGGIVLDRSDAATVEALTELCKMHSAGLNATCRGQSSQMIIYPAKAEEFRFLEATASDISTESVLHFRLFQKLPGTPINAPLSVLPAAMQEPENPMVVLARELAGIDPERLLTAKKSSKQPRSAVFLMLPCTHQAELEAYAAYFEGQDCIVYHSETPGAWDYFRNKYQESCLVLVHPDIPLWQIPGLDSLLALNRAGVRVFSVGVDRTVALLEGRKPAFGCERLFPHGNVVFITDDVFFYRPDQAYDVISSFLESNKLKPKGGENNRIAARPGLKQWLLHLTTEKTPERGRTDDREWRWLRLYDSICKLCPEECEDPWDLPSLSPPSLLISISPDLLPDYAALWERNESEATDFMVNWFAGWSVLHAGRYRKFTVCYEPKPGSKEVVADANWKINPDPRGWADRFQHIGVSTPSQVAALLAHKKK